MFSHLGVDVLERSWLAAGLCWQPAYRNLLEELCGWTLKYSTEIAVDKCEAMHGKHEEVIL